MIKKKTVGQIALEAKQDTAVYDPIDVAESLTGGILKEIWACIDAHHKKIDEPEFCVVMLRGPDSLIQGVRRHKYYAWPFLPKPRPEQTVFHYRKSDDTIQRLWSLPNAKVMAVISEMTNVSPQWKETKAWCDAFFHGFKYSKKENGWINRKKSSFYDFVRFQKNIDLESEEEYLNAHRSELIKARSDDGESTVPDAFDFSKIMVQKVIDPLKPISK